MSGLVNLGLLVILGVLQATSAGYENKNTEIKYIEYEVNCSFTNLKSLIEDYHKYSSILKDSKEFRENTMQGIISMIEARNKCDCGKEVEDKKCQEEFLNGFKGMMNTLYLFHSVYYYIIVEAMQKINEKTSLALSELLCCCKVEVCQKKLEYPEAKYKGPIKECKSEKCNSQLSKFISDCPDLLGQEISGLLLLEHCVEEYEKLVKSKEEIPSEGKCQKETAAALFLKVLNVKLCFEKLIGTQLVGYETFTSQKLPIITETTKELIRCSKESLKGKKD